MIKLVEYSILFEDDLTEMLEDFAEEVFDEPGRVVDIDAFVNSHNYIYLIIRDKQVIGFISYYLMDYYGMRDMVLNQDYLYIKENHRRSKAIHLANVQTGLLVKTLKCDLSLPLANGNLEKGLGRRIKSQMMYSTYEYKQEDILSEYDRLCKIIYKD